MGILSSIMDVGQSTGPMVAGVMIGAYSYRMVFGIVGVALVELNGTGSFWGFFVGFDKKVGGGCP